jgi:metal iron transporter
MPHTLYHGSGLVQSRLRDFDVKNSSYHDPMTIKTPVGIKLYRPSLSAIKSCMKYSIAELCITLFVVAIFVNSSILIIAASSLSETAQDADLFGIYNLFVSSISQAAGTMFALALLFLKSVQELWPPWQDNLSLRVPSIGRYAPFTVVL